MIVVSESLIRHSRRLSVDPSGGGGGNPTNSTSGPINSQHTSHTQRPISPQQQQRRPIDPNDPTTKHQLIDNLLASSPPLPAPPIMPTAQILQQERELELQMAKLQMQQQQRGGPRVSITSMTIDPAFAPPAVQPPPAVHQPATALKSRASTAAAPTADWFAKVEVAPRPVAPVSSFVPSSLAAALTDSGMLHKSRDDFARVSTRDPHYRNDRIETVAESRDANTLTIYLHPYSDVSVRPAKIRLQLPAANTTSHDGTPVNSNPTTEEVIANLLHKWTSGELRDNFGLRAQLQPTASAPDKWCLRMVDEDTIGSDEDDDDSDCEEDGEGEGSSRMSSGEEVGMPEEDLPPLERAKPVRMFGATVLAMTVAEGVEHRMPINSPQLPRPESPSSQTHPHNATSSTQPSSRNPAAANNMLRRYDTMRVTPTHGALNSSAAASTQSPNSKGRAVSIFSSAGTPAATLDTNASNNANANITTSQSQHTMSHDPSRLSIFGDNPMSPKEPKFYLKIHIGDHETHILGLLKSQLLADALPLLSVKKHALVAMKADHYRFTYVDPLLRAQNDLLKDMTKVLISSLASDELNLVPRLASGSGDTSTATPSVLDDRSSQCASTLAPADAPSLSSFQFSLDTASNYCEYKVIKTNQRGKRQPRIFGIDRYKIYNKTQSGMDEGEGGMFSFIQRRISSDQGVSRAFRLINTIASVHVVSLRPTCFCINFKSDGRKDSPIVQNREYETETKMECAEIVAKIRFLMSHAVYEPPVGAGQSIANAGMLASSIK